MICKKKAKTLVKKIKDMNNKSGDCLDRELFYTETTGKFTKHYAIPMDYKPSITKDFPIKDKDKPVEIEKLDLDENNTDEWKELSVWGKINELVEWINDHQRQHDLDD